MLQSLKTPFPNLSRLVAWHERGRGRKRGWFCVTGKHVHTAIFVWVGLQACALAHPTHTVQLQIGHRPVVGCGTQVAARCLKNKANQKIKDGDRRHWSRSDSIVTIIPSPFWGVIYELGIRPVLIHHTGQMYYLSQRSACRSERRMTSTRNHHSDTRNCLHKLILVSHSWYKRQWALLRKAYQILATCDPLH